MHEIFATLLRDEVAASRRLEKIAFEKTPVHVFRTEIVLEEDRALLALQMLVEGTSIRSIERITGIEKNTILSLLRFAGERCEDLTKRYMDHTR